MHFVALLQLGQVILPGGGREAVAGACQVNHAVDLRGTSSHTRGGMSLGLNCKRGGCGFSRVLIGALVKWCHWAKDEWKGN